jgi:microcystin-dependent protein
VTDQYIGEIRMFAGTFAPVSWAFCNGQLVPINQNPPLFTLIGTTYGGDGQTTFGLPNLQGKLPVHQTTGFAMGQIGGTETVNLTTQQIPAHSHTFSGSLNDGTQTTPAGYTVAKFGPGNAYIVGTPTVALAPGSVGNDGGGQAHSNMQPYQCVSFIIALEGIWPSQS